MHVIEFKPDGTAQAMHNDAFSLAFLGKQEIIRASEIKFNSETQRWGIWLPCEGGRFMPASATPAHGFDTYDAARRCEVEWMNQCRLAGVEPDSGYGFEILEKVRTPRT